MNSSGQCGINKSTTPDGDASQYLRAKFKLRSKFHRFTIFTGTKDAKHRATACGSEPFGQGLEEVVRGHKTGYAIGTGIERILAQFAGRPHRS
jgi:hypothetical protein